MLRGCGDTRRCVEWRRLVALSSAWIAAGLAAVLAVAPAEKADVAQASELAQTAQARFETAEFASAIELWSRAYDLLPDTAEYAAQRSMLTYQMAHACVEAYALDPQLGYLRKAERLFAGYLQTLSDQDPEGVAEVEKTLTELRAKIAESEAAAVVPAPAITDEGAEAEALAEAKLAAQRREEARAASDRRARRWRRLTVAGGVTAGVGVGLLGVMSYGLVRGRQVDAEGQREVAEGGDPGRLAELLQEGTRANHLAIATGVVGGVLAAAGIVLVSRGVVGERRARSELVLAPVWSPGGGLVAVAGRF